MMRFAVLCLVLVAVGAKPTSRNHRWYNGCGASMYPEPESKPFIVGGEQADQHQFPYQGLLKYFGSLYCGAVLITPTYALTAAHCTDGVNANNFDLSFGEHSRNNPNNNVQSRGVSIIQHEDYSSFNIRNDISLLRMDSAIDIHSSRTPACHPSQGVDGYVGDTSTISGWGTTSSGGSTPDILRFANVPVMSYNACDGSQNGILPGMLCAGYDGSNEADACQGDSGGPLTVQTGGLWEIVGLVSWGYGCAGSTPGVYTEVAYYQDWIDSNM